MTSESNPTRASVTVSTSAKDVFLATFPVLPPGAGDSMAFNVYGKLSDPTVKPSTTSTAAGKKRRLLVAETEKSQFSGDSAATKGHARYLVGIYSPSKHSLVLKEALPMLMTSRLKALTDPDARVIDKTALARTALGEQFGTKKRKKELRAKEQNRVAVAGLEGVSVEIQASVDEQVEEATSASGAAGSTTDSGPRQHSDITPPCHASAARKEDVYLLSDLISPENLKAISVTPIFKLGSMDAVKENFANLNITAFVDQRMASAIKAKDTKNTKMLLYLAYLMKLFRMKDRDISPGFLAARSLQGCPQQVCDSLVSDFTEYATDGAGVVKYRMTPKLKDKLLAYICTLCLHLDEFSLELNSLAADLSLSMTKLVKVIKELGCRVDALKRSETGTTGLKRALLVLPLTFPAPPRGKARS